VDGGAGLDMQPAGFSRLDIMQGEPLEGAEGWDVIEVIMSRMGGGTIF